MAWALAFAVIVVCAFVIRARISYMLELRRSLRMVRESAAAFRATKELPERPNAASTRVFVTEDAVEVRPPGRAPERIEWSCLAEVAVRTTSAGPWGEDFFLLLGDDAGSGVVIPQEAASEVLPHLQRLPGFDNGALVRAMGSTDNDHFVCWRRR